MFKVFSVFGTSVSDSNVNSYQKIGMGLLAFSKVQCLLAIVLILSGHFLAAPTIAIYAMMVIAAVVFALKGRVKD